MDVVKKAAELKKGLEEGQVLLAEITAWADQVIEESDEPFDEIMDLSMAETENDAISCLSDLINTHGD